MNVRRLMNKLAWYIKQLLPLKYHTTYMENGKRYIEVWRMWFGRCFKSERFEITRSY